MMLGFLGFGRRRNGKGKNFGLFCRASEIISYKFQYIIRHVPLKAIDWKIFREFIGSFRCPPNFEHPKPYINNITKSARANQLERRLSDGFRSEGKGGGK